MLLFCAFEREDCDLKRLLHAPPLHIHRHLKPERVGFGKTNLQIRASGMLKGTNDQFLINLFWLNVVSQYNDVIWTETAPDFLDGKQVK